MPYCFQGKFIKIFILIFIISTSLSSHDCLTMDIAKTIFNNEGKQPIMVLDNTISLEEAYCGQEKLNYLINKKYNDKIGYKVGFTGKALQERFNIKSPASGVLYKHMFLKNDDLIIIKPEIGFAIDKYFNNTETKFQSFGFSIYGSYEEKLDGTTSKAKIKETGSNFDIVDDNTDDTFITVGLGYNLDNKESFVKIFGFWWFSNQERIVENLLEMRFDLLGDNFIPQHSDARILDQLIYKWSDFRKSYTKILTKKYENLILSGYSIEVKDIEKNIFHHLYEKPKDLIRP